MQEISLLIVIGIIVGSNNLAVALALGALGQSGRIWRIVSVFGVIEFVVPLIGILLGIAVSGWIEQHFGWLGIVLLAVVGIWIISSSISGKSSDEKLARYATTWQGIILLGLLLSIDNLVIGFSLGLMRIEALTAAITISLFSMFFSWLGIRIGDVSRRRLEQVAKIMAGFLLLLMALAVYRGWI